jgi:hypothetical protein
MDEEAMLVDRVLQPYVETAPPGVMPILFLDAYRCHMMASVVTRIQNLGVEVQHIPGGCTLLCQPVDLLTLVRTSPSRTGFAVSGKIG